MLAYSNANMARQQCQQYRQQNVLTASPGELTLMLYDSCIKNLRLAKIYFEEKNIEKRSTVLIKAQKIISELVASLDSSYDISNNLLQLYEFMLHCMKDANMHQSSEKLDPAIELLSELRDTWQQAIRLSRHEV